MKMTRMLVPILFVLLNLPCAYAQEKQAEEAPAGEAAALQTPLKVQLVLTEYDGAKKVSSMPYTMSLVASQEKGIDSGHSHNNDWAHLRVGARVPVATQKNGDNGGGQFQYVDIGTNIDCYAWGRSDDRYLVRGTVDRSSVYTLSSTSEPEEWKGGSPNFGNDPIIRHMSGDFAIALHDGQMGETTVATDPITGHVLKVEVMLNVVK